MASGTQEWIGTWEELAAYQANFAGRRLHIRVLPLPAGTNDPRLAVLQEIDTRSQSMNPQPDTHNLLREGREGAMFGE